MRVFGTSHVAGALPGVAWQRPETMPSACLTTPPDVLVCTRSVEWIAQQRFAAVQVAWVEGTLSLALMRHLAAPASLGGIDFWVLPLADQAEAFRTRYGLSPARFLPCESAHHDAGGEGAETDARCWERMLRELLAGETTLVQRVVQHLAARRAAVAHRIVTSEPRPPALAGRRGSVCNASSRGMPVSKTDLPTTMSPCSSVRSVRSADGSSRTAVVGPC